MGFLKPQEKTPPPIELKYIFDIYKEIRFSVTQDLKLSPRAVLTYADIRDFNAVTSLKLSGVESGIILSIDAIFNIASNR